MSDSRPRPSVDRRQRPNRWQVGVGQPLPGVPKSVGKLNGDQWNCFLVRLRLEELTQKLKTQNSALLDKIAPPGYTASPESEPIYDPNGKRLNTQEQRWRDTYAEERQQVIERAMALSPLFRAPADYSSLGSKRTAKLYIPYREYPTYNFIGLILGPRGNTQKRLERQTGTTIVIRGRGSQKPGRGRQADDDELHVLVTADTQGALELAVGLVKKLLVPVPDSHNEQKRVQLDELARLNGSRGQSWYEDSRPDWNAPGSQCAVCSDPGHVAADCLLNGRDSRTRRLEGEFDAFLSEIGEAPQPSKWLVLPPVPKAASRRSEDEAYAQFQKSLHDLELSE